MPLGTEYITVNMASSYFCELQIVPSKGIILF